MRRRSRRIRIHVVKDFGELLDINIFVLARIIKAEIQIEREANGVDRVSLINKYIEFKLVIGI